MFDFLKRKHKHEDRAETYLSEGMSSRGASPQASPVSVIDASVPQFPDYDSDVESDDSCQRRRAVQHASPRGESMPASSRISVQGITSALPALRSGVVVLGSDGSPTLVTAKLGSSLQPPRSPATFSTDDFPGGGGESSTTTFKKRLSTLAQPLEMASTPPPTTAQLVTSDFAQSSVQPVRPAQTLSARQSPLHR